MLFHILIINEIISNYRREFYSNICLLRLNLIFQVIDRLYMEPRSCWSLVQLGLWELYAGIILRILIEYGILELFGNSGE